MESKAPGRTAPKWKSFLKALVFLVLFGLIFNYVFSVLWLRGLNGSETIQNFYQETASIDVIYIGSSVIYNSFIAPQAFHDHGIAVYPLAAAAMPFRAVKPLISECQKSQSPMLYIIDIRTLPSNYDEVRLREIADSMRFSWNRLHAIQYMLELSPEKQDITPFVFSFIKYHSHWTNLTQEDFNNEPQTYRSYAYRDTVESFKKPNYNLTPKTPKKGLADIKLEALNDLLDYLNTLDAEVLFAVIPFHSTSMTKGYLYSLEQAITIIRQRGFTLVDFNLDYDAIGINFKTDYADPSHMNYKGAKKYTAYLSRYLKAHYDLPDRRDDPAYSGLEADYQRLCADHPKYVKARVPEASQ